jgi:NADH dehydrogenase
MKKKIIVVGGGYGGTEVIRQLLMRGIRNVEVELVSNKTHFENTIGGTELISDKTKPGELKYDLKELSNYWNFELTIGSVENIDLNGKILRIGKGQKDYDVLVLAAGSEPNFYNVEGANLAYSAYHLSDFIIINEKLKQLNSNIPNVIVAGAGFVGLEVAAETLDLFKAIKKKANLIIVEKMSSALPAYNNASARKLGLEYFTSRGVKFILGKGVKAIDKEKLILEDGSHVENDLTIWTAGVKGPIVPSQIVGGNLHRGCIEVDDRLLIKGKEDAFAIGDVAYARINEKEAAKLAGEALEQAKTVAKNIGLIAEDQKPKILHTINYTTDYPKALLSMGEGKAMLIFGQDYVSTGSAEYFLKKRIDFQEIMDRFPQ